MKTRILYCDDHKILGKSFTNSLEKFLPNHHIEFVDNSFACIEYLKENEVEFLITDLNIDQLDGFDLIEFLISNHLNTKVIILSAYAEEHFVTKSKRYPNVYGFLSKTSEIDSLLSIILYNEKKFENLTNTKNHKESFNDIDSTRTSKFKLTKQEIHILKLVVSGKTSQEISRDLFISKNTVDTHRRNINRKLNVTSIVELIRIANENQLI